MFFCFGGTNTLIHYKINCKQIGEAKGARMPWGQGKQGDWDRFSWGQGGRMGRQNSWYHVHRVAWSWWNGVWSVTWEHNHFFLSPWLDQKMIHIIKTRPITQAWDLPTGAQLLKRGAFQSEAKNKKRPRMKIVVVRKQTLFKINTLTHLHTQEQNVIHLRTLIISHSCSSGVGRDGVGAVITFMFPRRHRHSNLIIFLAVQHAQALLFHDQLAEGWGGVGWGGVKQ